MTVDEIKEILELMREHELAEFELQRDGETLRLRKHSPNQWTVRTADGSRSAQFEHSLAITESGAEILTRL